MDPSSTHLGRMLLEEIAPVIMVLRTPLVEKACLKNGLSFIEMLTPFCEFNNIDVPVRTSSDQPYRLQKFKLRLFYASDVREPSSEVSSERLRHVVLDAAKNLTYTSDDTPAIEDALIASRAEIVPSWFQIFNKELYRTLSFSDHEAFDHPVACLLVVSSKDELPINRFIDLFNTNQLPSLLNDGVMDPKILKYYLLVHDNQDDTSENAAQILSEMISTFGPNVCRLLSINSSADGCINDEDFLWFTHSNGSSANRQLGCFFSSDDLNEIKTFMRDLTSKHVISHMEQKVRLLNQQVSATRKGFRNQLKNLWWRKGKEDMPNLSNSPMYTFSSIESQIRVLGDYAFMLRDYELASSNYRLLSTDYKLDKAWKHYAGVQEMLGLTYFMLDQSRKEAEYCMENAFSTYLKLGSLGLQNASRSGIWWAEMLKSRDSLKDAAGVYARLSCEVFLQESLLSAVMLEQASYCYLFSKPVMLRKYGFNLLRSGDIYNQSDQKKHAIRTYRNALSVYNGSKWSCVKEHVHFQIGKWYTSIGMFDVAVAHMLEALVCIYQSKSTQEIFLRDFLDIVQKTGRTFEVLKLSLPVINDASLRVIFEDHRTYASPAAVNVAETTWELLEEDLVQCGSRIKPNWMESQSENFMKKFNESLFCVVGEEIQLYVEFQNPLQTPLSIFNVSLSCELTPQSYGAEPEAAEFTITELNPEFFMLSQADFALDGGEISSVRLTVTPTMEGILKIIGIKWKLSSHVVGFHHLSLGPNRRKVFMERRKSNISEIDSLNFFVVKCLPRLEGSVHHLPSKAYMGDTRAVVLELKNLSQSSVVNMRMKISDPRFLGVAHQDVVDLDFPACLERRDNMKLNHACDIEAIGASVFPFPEDTIIQDGKPLLCPLWLRAAVPGNIALYIIIYYELNDLTNPISYRTLRMHFSLEVLPSLDVSFHVNSSLRTLNEHMVRMDVVNKACSESFHVHQLSSVGLWELSLLERASTFFPSQILTPGQTVSCFFRLKPCGNSEKSTHERSDVCFSPDTERIYRVSHLPLACFRHQQDQHTADFVLVFWPADNNLKSMNHHSPHVFCHRISHCNVIPVGTPIQWVILGQHVVSHKFNECPCEVKLKMMIYNSSNAVISVRVSMLDPFARNREAADTDGLGFGWHDPTRETAGSISVEASPPFIWSGLSSRSLELDPLVSIEIPLEVTLFSPGMFDLSDYAVHWSFMPSARGSDDRQVSGSCLGHPYYLTAVQSL